jgi:hypothetical protein
MHRPLLTRRDGCRQGVQQQQGSAKAPHNSTPDEIPLSDHVGTSTRCDVSQLA